MEEKVVSFVMHFIVRNRGGQKMTHLCLRIANDFGWRAPLRVFLKTCFDKRVASEGETYIAKLFAPGKRKLAVSA